MSGQRFSMTCGLRSFLKTLNYDVTYKPVYRLKIEN